MSEEDRDDIRPSVTELSIKQTEQRMKDLADEIRRVAKKEKITEPDNEYLRELNEEFDELDGHYQKLERDALINKVDLRTGNPLTVVRGDNPRKSNEMDRDIMDDRQIEENRSFSNPWDLSEVRSWNRSESEVGSELRARALTAIERMQGASDDVRQAATEIIEKFDTPSGKIAKQALLTSSPDYISAFNKAARGRESAMTDRERAAVERAMSLTDSEGGYLVPFQLDPTVIITSDGSTNPVRQIARKVVATGDTWNGVSSAAVSWEWLAEATEAADAATTFAQPSIPIYKATGFVPISMEALQDEQNVAGEVGRLLAFGKDTLESAAFVTGTGSAQPTGIVQAVTTTGDVDATTGGAFGIEDLYLLDESLPARYRRNASWIADRAIYNDVRQFSVGGGADVWERLQFDQPPLLLGRPAYEASDMSSTITTDQLVLLLGDFENYVIADRLGTTVEFIPHLFATGANRPSGQRGWFAHYRVGADSVNDSAFKVLRL
ncbi:MAG: phage major capsid protein [Acidimicrobiia bacterium]|nr:phage major capsid protein [Acidimicrobiia bacterium]